MRILDHLKSDWAERRTYERFEQGVSRFLLFFISLIILYTTALAVIEVVGDLRLGMAFLGTEVMQDAFGSILTVVILLEFNHSIALALKTRTGAIQVRIIVLIAILALARKFILLDYKAADVEKLLGLGGVALALGVLYWLVADGDHRKRPSAPAGN